MSAVEYNKQSKTRVGERKEFPFSSVSGYYLKSLIHFKIFFSGKLFFPVFHKPEKVIQPQRLYLAVSEKWHVKVRFFLIDERLLVRVKFYAPFIEYDGRSVFIVKSL